MAEIEISIVCNQCGGELGVIVKRGNEIEVKPCAECMLEEYNKGFDTANKGGGNRK